MRKLMMVVVLVSGTALFAQDQKASGPVVCVSTVTDTTGRAIGPLGNLNNDLAEDITQHRKPLRGLGVAADINGKTLPNEECDYILEITLHLGGSTTVTLNPPRPSPYDPGVDARGGAARAQVQAIYKLTSTSKAAKSITLEDDGAKEPYEPNVGGVGTNLRAVAIRVAQSAAYNATGRLKKKLKL